MKVLVAGVGSIGQRHIRNLRTEFGDGVEILAYRTRGLDRVLTDQLSIVEGARADEHYGIEVFTDLGEALSEKPDVAFVTNPSSLHIATALQAAKAGCHLFIEKPLSHSLDGIDELARVAAEKSLVVALGYQLRFHPCIRLVGKLLAEGSIGRVLGASLHVGEYLPAWHAYEDYRQMYAARKDLGGGVVFTQIHEIDLVYSWFGMPRQAFALGGHWSELEIDVEDTASILLECSHHGRPLPAHLYMDYVQRPTTRKYEILGDCGRIVVDIVSNRVEVVSADPEKQPEVSSFPDFVRNQMFVDELKQFFDSLDGSAEPEVSLADGVQSFKIAMAAMQSIEAGTSVKLG